MHPRLYDLFHDANAAQENTRHFRPDTIGFETEIGICSLTDQAWESDGIQFQFLATVISFHWN